MKTMLTLNYLLCFICLSCNLPADQTNVLTPDHPEVQQVNLPAKEIHLNPTGKNIAHRFETPQGYKRVIVKESSYGDFLRHLDLKAVGAKVHLYNGVAKSNQGVHAAVIDIDVGRRDLQQCADAIMRLRAEYLFLQKKMSDIHFKFVNGFNAKYEKWRSGYRIQVKGNEVYWVKTTKESLSYESFRKYLNMVFAYAGTLSLEREMEPVPLKDMAIGDVFIQGGSPGHAVVVVDLAVNARGEKVFMLAQSYMPAQDIHVLINPLASNKSPWYPLEFGTTLRTPEWNFRNDELKRFAK